MIRPARRIAWQLAGLVPACVGTGIVAAALEKWRPINSGVGWTGYLWSIPALVAICVVLALVVALVAACLRWSSLEDRRFAVLLGSVCGLGSVPLLFPPRFFPGEPPDLWGVVVVLVLAILMRGWMARYDRDLRKTSPL